MTEKQVLTAKQTFHKWPKGAYLADFHIHSKYSRATSTKMNVKVLNEVAKEKGIKVLGTGDFTHPGYLRELKRDLVPDGTGLYRLKDDPDGTRFILTAEVSNIFTQHGKNRRIHTVLFAPSIEVVEDIQARLAAIGNITSDGRPIFGFPVKELIKIIKKASKDCEAVPAHVWTPWFSLFGAKSGFDDLEECFEEESHHIFALETGLSSDPQMNWRLSKLDKYTLISNSDAHSPTKLAREANILSCPLTYKDIIKAMKDPSHGFLGTIEFFPEEGKYHYDGHRSCGICWHPSETRRHNGLCPVCGNPVTVGVLHRVEDLADREEGFVPKNALPNCHLIPLAEIIAEAFGLKSITKTVLKEYSRIISLVGTEMDVLLWKELDELKLLLPGKIYEGIRRMREGMITIIPGHDGVYGKISLFDENYNNMKKGEGQTSNNSKSPSPKQLSLF